MRSRLVSVLVVGGAVLAFVATSASAATQSKSQSSSHHHSLSGEITAYDANSHTLTVKTTKGATTFGVADAKVYVASKSVGLDEIAKQVGTTASVSYTMKNGQRTASSVRITPAKTASSSKS